MLLYLSLSGVLLSALLIYFNARRSRSSIYLGLFFFLVSFYSFHHYIFIYTKSVFWIGVLYVNTTSVFYLTGPMCYFYIRSVLTDDARLRWKDAWHFLPAVLHFAAAMAYVVKPWSYKMEIAQAIADNISFMASHKVNYFAQLLNSTRPIYLSRPLLALGYAIASLIMFIRFQSKNKKSGFVVLSAQQRIIKRWLILFLSFQFLLFFSFASLILIRWPVNPVPPFMNFKDLEFIVAIALISLLITPYLFPRIVYGLPDLHANPVLQETVSYRQPAEKALKQQPSDPEASEEKNSGLQLDDDYLIAIGKKIEECMREQEPYLLPDFNLIKLSQLLEIQTHHLGYFFREVKQQTFNEYRNEWRVRYAIALLKVGKASEITLEAIGNKSGFNSRSAFFNAFKKVTGVSPGNFEVKECN